VCECEFSALGILHTFYPWPIGANKYTAGCTLQKIYHRMTWQQSC